MRRDRERRGRDEGKKNSVKKRDRQRGREDEAGEEDRRGCSEENEKMLR